MDDWNKTVESEQRHELEETVVENSDAESLFSASSPVSFSGLSQLVDPDCMACIVQGCTLCNVLFSAVISWSGYSSKVANFHPYSALWDRRT